MLQYLTLLPLPLLLWAVTRFPVFMDAAHNGQTAGNLSMALAAVFALYGLLLSWWANGRHGIRAISCGVTLTGLVWLIYMGLFANGRWATPEYRYGAYIAVLGAQWGLELVTLHRGPVDDVRGFLGRLAAAAVYLIIPFEVHRWLEPSWTAPLGTRVSLETLHAQTVQSWTWTAALWVVWSFLVVLVRRR